MVNKWDIYFCNLNPTVGSEQRGIRPVLIVSNDVVNHLLPVSTVLPLSSAKKGEKIYPTEILLFAEETGLSKNSIAMCQQIRTISHDRLVNLAGSLTDVDMREEINKSLRLYFDL